METTKYVNITHQQAIDKMNDDAIILDVRTEEEFEQGHIKNAILLSIYEFNDKFDSILLDKSQTILIYCRTGRKSKIIAYLLYDLGYTNVYDFGGIVDWKGEIIID